MTHLMGTYPRRPVTLVRGEGPYVFDDEGRRYLDGVSGLGVMSLGHGHPAILTAIREQAGVLVHASNLYATEPAEALAGRLVRACFGADGDGSVFLCNSGSEATEAAIKIARKRGGPGRHRIIVLRRAFHGGTYGALAASPLPALQAPFGPLLPGFDTAVPGDVAQLRAMAAPDLAAVLLEPVQGEGGVWPLGDDFLAAARELCDRTGALLIVDEVLCGMGRTGTFLAHAPSGVVPDVVLLANALGGGLPIGAVVAGPEAMDVLAPGDHASTFGGNPLACAAACAAVDALGDPSLLSHVRETGALLAERLGPTARGRGLMLAIERPDAAEVVAAALSEGVLLDASGPTTVRLLPPLIIDRDQALALARAATAGL
jgi:acetylornithine/succinyldiaminopimelate/putrescine aminotransferase